MKCKSADGNELLEDSLTTMERYFHRYWGNFARSGDPNNEEGAVYPEEVKSIYETEVLPSWPKYDGNAPITIHFGYNSEDNDNINDCEFRVE